MASHEPKALGLDVNRLKSKFDLSHFDLNAVLRGIQLTFVGGPYTRPAIPQTPMRRSILTFRATSQPRPPEPRPLHQPPLQAGCVRRGCGDRHPARDIHSGACSPPSLATPARVEPNVRVLDLRRQGPAMDALLRDINGRCIVG